MSRLHHSCAIPQDEHWESRFHHIFTAISKFFTHPWRDSMEGWIVPILNKSAHQNYVVEVAHPNSTLTTYRRSLTSDCKDIQLVRRRVTLIGSGKTITASSSVLNFQRKNKNGKTLEGLRILHKQYKAIRPASEFAGGAKEPLPLQNPPTFILLDRPGTNYTTEYRTLYFSILTSKTNT